MIEIREVVTDKDIDLFIDITDKIYDDKDYYIKPLRGDYKKYITGKTTAVNKVGDSKMFIALKDGEVVGRILVGINEELNEYHNLKDAYFSQFESIDDREVSKALYDTAAAWAKNHGANKLKGPMSLPGGDDNRGFLLDNFDDYPYIQNVYNKSYYNDHIVYYGFKKYHDCFAFSAKPTDSMIERYERVIPYAMKKYKFRLDKINLDKEGIKKDARDISDVMKIGMPKNEDWQDLMPPSDEEIDDIVSALRPYADSDLIYIARNENDEPIAFNITMPDYNQIIKHMNGKMNLSGIIKYLYYKNKINRLRVFVLFVIPEYRNKGVTQAMYLKTLRTAIEKGYTEVEGSTIWDYNVPMINDILKVGGELSKTYRVYEIDL